MIERMIIAYLGDVLNVPVFGDKPNDNVSDEFVTVEKTGSRERNHIKAATLAVQSWSHSRAAAEQLNETVKAAMDNAVTLDSVSRSHCETDYNFPDIVTKRPRYQAIYEVVYYDQERR